MTAISGSSNPEKATKIKSNSLENIKSRLGEISYMGAKIVALGNMIKLYLDRLVKKSGQVPSR